MLELSYVADQTTTIVVLIWPLAILILCHPSLHSPELE